MNKIERIKAALNFEDVDRIPTSVWMHLSEFDQDPKSLAEEQVAFTRKYDYDFIKMMPFGTYSIQDWGAKIKIYCDRYKEPIIADTGIKSIEDYGKLMVLEANHGTWGKQVQFAKYTAEILDGEMPFIQTIFSPITTLKKLAGDRLFKDIKESPDEVHKALRAITDTTINFVRANIEIGVSGFFLATQCASYDIMDDETYSEFAAKYDYEVIAEYSSKTYFNVIHVHGENIMFDTINNTYDCNCLNWHDRHTSPDFKTAREKSKKCFLGGIQEVPFFVDGVLNYDSILKRSTPKEVEIHIREAIDSVGTKGIIIGPGCVADPKTSEENLIAVSRAVRA